MLRSLFAATILGLLVVPLPCPTLACSICGTTKPPLSEELEKAKLVFYGTALKSRLAAQPDDSGGSTEFQIERVLKDNPFRGAGQTITIGRYVPILDPKNPPKYLVFCDIFKDKLDPYLGKALTSPAILDYLDGLSAFKGKERLHTLVYCFRFLDHPDELVANDAFLAFARSSDQEVGQAARHLAPDKLRTMLNTPATKADRFGLLAFLLGACGGDQDADFLRGLLEQPHERARQALDGILCGYIHLRPRQGWDLALALLANTKRPFIERYTVVRTLRFYRGWKWAETKAEILRCQEAIVADGELADLAIEDLRTWKVWDLTRLILDQYTKPSHATPIVRRGIVRYALCCPLPEARTFVANVRRADPALVRELEEGLEIEKEK